MSRGGRGRLRGDRNVQVITVQINGRTVELDGETRLLDYIERLGVNPRAIAVEHNGAILERAAYENAMLREGDAVEIVRMVGGGGPTRH